jgi:hypothetical protein
VEGNDYDPFFQLFFIDDIEDLFFMPTLF